MPAHQSLNLQHERQGELHVRGGFSAKNLENQAASALDLAHCSCGRNSGPADLVGHLDIAGGVAMMDFAEYRPLNHVSIKAWLRIHRIMFITAIIALLILCFIWIKGFRPSAAGCFKTAAGRIPAHSPGIPVPALSGRNGRLDDTKGIAGAAVPTFHSPMGELKESDRLTLDLITISPGLARMGPGEKWRKVEKIELDRETHIYSPDLPSVTAILQDVGLIDPTWFTEEGRARGSAVHLAAEYYDHGRLSFDDLDPRIEPYVRAFIKFRMNHPVQPTEWIEVPMADPSGLYAGTGDRIIIRDRETWDLKTGEVKPADRWQMAAYINMQEDPFSWRRFGLYLRENATYRVHEFPPEEFAADLNVWNSALTIYYTKRWERI